ncbi:RNA polymerase sigma factor [Nitriliruptoraceae bacterium ZYF776]|nr:RNA polymerase sigma factor [Profundirhabdus halotolerans]
MAPTRKDTTVDDVVARARRGDRRALEVLVDQHLDQLYTVALRIVGSPADAEDVVQEAVVRIWQQLPTFRGDARFSTWAYRIVTNLALDQVRRPRYETAVADAPDVPLEDLEPARLVEVSTELDRVGVALAQLTPPQRAAIVLAELVGLPQEDIAEVLDTTVSGVKNRLYRARTRLRQLLDEVDDPGLR